MAGSKPEDLTKRRFGYLVPLKAVGRTKHGNVIWNCDCTACGGNVEVPAGDLKSGHTTSCGCHRAVSIAKARTKHGDSKRSAPTAAEFHIWCSIRQRCTNPANPAYQSYGGRGIHCCIRWRDYSTFLKDMGRRPSPQHSIDRIDNNKGYTPTNCRWATRIEQANNKRTSRVLTLGEDSLTLSEWARIAGLKRTTLRRRLEAGWDLHVALTTPAAVQRPHEIRYK